MTQAPPNPEDSVLLQFHRDSVERIHAELEAAGGETAKKSRELRAIYAYLMKATAEGRSSGYYSRFDDPLDAVMAYLFQANGACDRNDLVRDIASMGFSGRTDEPKKALRDSIYYQTKPQNNGRYQVIDVGEGMLRLTESGALEAKRLIDRYGAQ